MCCRKRHGDLEEFPCQQHTHPCRRFSEGMAASMSWLMSSATRGQEAHVLFVSTCTFLWWVPEEPHTSRSLVVPATQTSPMLKRRQTPQKHPPVDLDTFSRHSLISRVAGHGDWSSASGTYRKSQQPCSSSCVYSYAPSTTSRRLSPDDRLSACSGVDVVVALQDSSVDASDARVALQHGNNLPSCFLAGL